MASANDVGFPLYNLAGHSAAGPKKKTINADAEVKKVNEYKQDKAISVRKLFSALMMIFIDFLLVPIVFMIVCSS